MRGNGYAGVPAANPGVADPRTVFPEPDPDSVEAVVGADSGSRSCDDGEFSSWIGETLAAPGMAGCPPLAGISLLSICRAKFSRYSFNCRCASLESGPTSLSVLQWPSFAPGNESPATVLRVSSPCGCPKSLADDAVAGTPSGWWPSLNELDLFAGAWETGPVTSDGCCPPVLARPPVICSSAVSNDGRGTINTSLAMGQFDCGWARRVSLSAGSVLVTLAWPGDEQLLLEFGNDS